MTRQLQLSFGDYTFCSDSCAIYYKGKQRIGLRRKEYELLEFMAKNKEKVVNRLTILQNVWQHGTPESAKTLDVHMVNLRKRLKSVSDTSFIRTIHGLGYKLCDSED